MTIAQRFNAADVRRSDPKSPVGPNESPADAALLEFAAAAGWRGRVWTLDESGGWKRKGLSLLQLAFAQPECRLYCCQGVWFAPPAFNWEDGAST